MKNNSANIKKKFTSHVICMYIFNILSNIKYQIIDLLIVVETNKYKSELDKKIKMANEQTGVEDKLLDSFNRRSMSISDLKTNKNKKSDEEVDKLFEDLKLEKDKSIKNSYYYSMQKEQLAMKLKKKAFDINAINQINNFSDISELKKLLSKSLVFEEVNAKKVPITVRLNENSKANINSSSNLHKVVKPVNEKNLLIDFKINNSNINSENKPLHFRSKSFIKRIKHG